MCLKRKIEINSDLQIEAMVENLQRITRKFGTSPSNKFMFEGKVDRKGFKILPIFNYGYREKLRPEIYGSFLNYVNINQVLIKFGLPIGLKIIIILALIFNIGLIMVMIFFPTLTDFPFWDKWWVLLLFLGITISIFFGYYRYKVSKSIKILKEVLNSKPMKAYN